MTKPKAPTGGARADGRHGRLRTPGRRLWSSVVDDYQLEEHEAALLVEAVRTVDLLDLLDARVRDEGPIVASPQGPKANPAAVEAGQQRIALAPLLAALRLPSGTRATRPPGHRAPTAPLRRPWRLRHPGLGMRKRRPTDIALDESGFPTHLAPGPCIEDLAEPWHKWPHLSARHRWNAAVDEWARGAGYGTPGRPLSNARNLAGTRRAWSREYPIGDWPAGAR